MAVSGPFGLGSLPEINTATTDLGWCPGACQYMPPCWKVAQEHKFGSFSCCAAVIIASSGPTNKQRNGQMRRRLAAEWSVWGTRRFPPMIRARLKRASASWCRPHRLPPHQPPDAILRCCAPNPSLVPSENAEGETTQDTSVSNKHQAGDE
jgi:hypothetical protein